MRMKETAKPGLFGQKHSSRDYTKEANWGKNIFNGSFPASLVAYMSDKGIEPVYLCVDEDNNLAHKYISGADLYGIDPLSEDAFYNFESGFSAFEKYYTGNREKIDLVMVNRAILHMCYTGGDISASEISRFQRSLIWIYLMLKDYVDYVSFDYIRIVKDHSYGNANDKAFAIPGKASWRLLNSPELTHPRIGKNEIKNIILGGGQNLLSPERRFDAVIVNSPDLFD